MGGRTVARLKTGSVDGPETAYLHADHLGSPVAATDEAGATLWAEHFTPYGESFPGPAANENDEGFTGHIQDTASGLTYMQARYYDPVIGRFLSNDPVGFEEGGVQYFNRYAYTANNPVNMVDPTGMLSCDSQTCTTEDGSNSITRGDDITNDDWKRYTSALEDLFNSNDFEFENGYVSDVEENGGNTEVTIKYDTGQTSTGVAAIEMVYCMSGTIDNGNI